MTKRSGFNKSIDKPLNINSPRYVACDIVDPKRNSLIKLTNEAKYANIDIMRTSSYHNKVKKEEEALYFQNQFTKIYGQNRNYKLRKLIQSHNLSPQPEMLNNQSSYYFDKESKSRIEEGIKTN